MNQRRFYFSTRDLLMMAALGGVVSTYANAIDERQDRIETIWAS